MAEFGRAVKITIGQVVVTDWNTSRAPNAQQKGLDCSFVVTRMATVDTGGPTPQPSTLSVFGLSEESREKISWEVREAREQSFLTQQALRLAQIRIEAGRPIGGPYPFLGLLAEDYVMDVTHEKEGADWRTDFVCEDGRLPYASARVNESRDGFYDPVQAALEVQAALGLDPDSDGVFTIAQGAPDLVAEGFRGFPGGLAIDASMADMTSQFLDAVDRVPISVGGKLVWTRPDAATFTQQVVLRQGTDNRPGTLLYVSEPEAGGVRRARALLHPLLEIGRQVVLQRADQTPLDFYPFHVAEVTHSGSTFGPEWYSDVVLRPSPL